MKIIKETPSVVMTKELMEKMGESVLKIGRILKYEGAGTVEFIVDKNLNYYFLEVNTRIQVEHPITEMITNTDLVFFQIQIAKGYSVFELGMHNIQRNGHAIEVRLYSEDPNNNFLPSIGRIHKIGNFLLLF